MKWRTAISKEVKGERFIRGHSLTALVKKHSFVEVVFLLLRGKLPTRREAKMFDTLLLVVVEHGIEAPSSFVARTVLSTGNPVNAALAAGVLTVGEWHGGAIERAMRMLQSTEKPAEIVRDAIQKSERLSGYGHKVYKDRDPRTALIFKKAKELGFYGSFCRRAYAIERELTRARGKKLPLNVDGAIAAVVSELKFDWRLGKAIFALGRFPGLIAHVHEEMVNEKPYRRLEKDEVEYYGS